jgi:hypothetical protein
VRLSIIIPIICIQILAMRVVASGAPTSAPQPRLIVSLVRVKTSDPNEKIRFDQYYELLSQKIPLVVEEAVQNDGPISQYLNELQIRRYEKDSAPSLAQLNLSWEQDRALQIMVTVTFAEHDSYIVQNSVYFGTLAGALKKNLLPLRQTVRAKEFADTRDLISVTTLYSLALDATSRQAPSNFVCDLLSSANRIAQGIGIADRPVLDLKSAIIVSLETSCRSGH